MISGVVSVISNAMNSDLVKGMLLASLVTTVIALLGNLAEVLVTVPFKCLRFMTGIDEGATKRAHALVADSCARHGWAVFSSDWLVDGSHSAPIGWSFCLWPLWNVWVAHVSITVGQRHFGEPHAADISLYWPRWRKVPTDLMRPRAGTCVPALPAGTRVLKTMNRSTSDYSKNWSKCEDETLPLPMLMPGAFDAAARMLKELMGDDYCEGDEQQQHPPKFFSGRVFYVNGPKDTGKTSAAKLLAVRLGAHYVDSYDFTNESHHVDVLLKDAAPITPDTPLVISIGEADLKLVQVVSTAAACCSNGAKGDSDNAVNKQQDVYDKGTLNQFLEDFAFKRSRSNVVLVLTGNTPFRHLEREMALWLGRHDTSCTDRKRMCVVNVGGDADHERPLSHLSTSEMCTPFVPGPRLVKHLSTNSPLSFKQNVDSDSDSCISTPSLSSDDK